MGALLLVLDHFSILFRLMKGFVEFFAFFE